MLRGLKFFVKFSWGIKKSYILLNALKQLLIGLLPIVTITMPKFIIDELTGAQNMQNIIFYLAILLLAIFLNSWLVTYIDLKIFNQRCYLSSNFGKFMHEKLANTDFCNLEDPGFFDMKEKANKFLYGDWHGFSYVLESAFSIIGKVFTLAGIIAIISTINIWIVLIFLIIVLLSALVDAKVKEKSHHLSLEAVNVERKWNYFTRILEDVGYSKEVRMNNLSKWLIDSELDYSYQAIEFYKKRNKYFSFSSLFNSTASLL